MTKLGDYAIDSQIKAQQNFSASPRQFVLLLTLSLTPESAQGSPAYEAPGATTWIRLQSESRSAQSLW